MIPSDTSLQFRLRNRPEINQQLSNFINTLFIFINQTKLSFKSHRSSISKPEWTPVEGKRMALEY